ncbi:MAG TPA: protein kinase domain-containing protein, partial [Elainellaceae cyanobacterium]
IQGQGTVTQLIEPLPFFRTEAARMGSINFWIEWDGRIHRLSREFPILLAQQYPDLVDPFQEFGKMLPSFEQATLLAAQIPDTESRGSDIFFYGPQETFTQFSFWQVLDPETWDKHVQEQTFKDKIVLVGPTATLFQDMHATPFGKMSGVEVHANAIATLLKNRAIAHALPNSYWRGVLVFVSALALGTLISQPQQPSARFRRTLLFLILWGVLGGGLFVGALLIIPTAVPMATIGLGGLSYVVTSLAGENLRKLKLRSTLKQYASSPIIQEIISQQDDLRDLLEEREREALGKLLGGRYQIIEVLGSGGFGETYIAADTQRPGNPLCVAKRLRPISDDLKLLHLARRLFQREAETLERLGKHEQIPQLFAYFEEDQEFYLVQEFIDGHPLREELISNQKLPEKWVVGLLKELLKVLEFIHEFGVIHRDIKPSNIIRRHSDRRLVVIDFGAVKEIHGGLIEDASQVNTVGIGTRGYMPNEQCAGHPRFNSDIYAVGVIGIQALTGFSPERLQEDPRTGEIIWADGLHITPELQIILTKMIRYDFSQRYQSVDAVLTDLENLPGLTDMLPVPFIHPVPILPKQDDSQLPHIHIVYDDQDCADDPIAPTRLWGEESCSEEHSPDA